MGMKETIETCVRQTRVVAIIRGFEPEVCVRLAEAYVRGGIRLVEVTFPQSDPDGWVRTTEAIRAIGTRFAGDLHVGAGTVLTERQLTLAQQAGATYMVTPNVKPELIRAAVARGLAALPGAFTPSEAVAAHEAGASFVKLFPAASLGPDYVKAIRAPLSHISFLAVGGISEQNAAAYRAAGCVGVGVGGNLTNRAWIESGAWDRIEETARKLVEVTAAS